MTIEDGAEVLDKLYGADWPERIDLEKLDLRSRCNCVVGQLSGSYDHLNLDADRAIALGFYKRPRQKWETLTAAWARLIRRRRAA